MPRPSDAIDFTVVTLKRHAGTWTMHARNTPLRALRRSTLESELLAAGFSAVRAYGSYALVDFDPAKSGDLVMVATR